MTYGKVMEIEGRVRKRESKWREKTLMLGKIEGKGRKGQQRMRWLDSITNSMGMNLSKLQDTVKDRAAWHATTRGVEMRWTQLSD